MIGYSSNGRKYELVGLMFVVTFIVTGGWLLNQGEYAIADDYFFYVFYVAAGKMDFFPAIKAYWHSESAAGRPLVAFLNLGPVYFIHAIVDLTWVRYLHLALLGGVVFLLVSIGRATIDNRWAAWLACGLILTTPGIWSLYIAVYGTGLLAAACFALLAARVSLSNDMHVTKKWALFTGFSLMAVFTYQPVFPLLLLGKLSEILGNAFKYSTRSSCDVSLCEKMYSRMVLRQFNVALIITMLVMLANFVFVKLFFQAARLSTGSGLAGQVEHIVMDLVPATIFPWLVLAYPSSATVKLLASVFFVFSTITIGFVVIKPYFAAVRALDITTWRVFGAIIPLILVSSALLPYALSIYLFTDQAENFRQVNYATISYWWTGSITIGYLLGRWKVNIWGLALARAGLWFSIIVVFAVTISFLYLGTVNFAAQEWAAAKCASKRVKLPASPVINKASVLLPVRFPSRYVGDEIQTRTLLYPTGNFLIWLSQVEVSKEPPLFGIWGMHESIDEGKGDWETAFTECIQ